jgi:hypothetical protein
VVEGQVCAVGEGDVPAVGESFVVGDTTGRARQPMGL